MCTGPHEQDQWPIHIEAPVGPVGSWPPGKLVVAIAVSTAAGWPCRLVLEHFSVLCCVMPDAGLPRVSLGYLLGAHRARTHIHTHTHTYTQRIVARADQSDVNLWAPSQPPCPLGAAGRGDLLRVPNPVHLNSPLRQGGGVPWARPRAVHPIRGGGRGWASAACSGV